jgi:hypothetical protein
MIIELFDHVGKSPTGEEVDHNQWVVMCDGVHVGYMQKSEGAWLACIVHMDEATKDELIEAVGKAAKIKVGGAAVPPDPDLETDEGENDDIDTSDFGNADKA